MSQIAGNRKILTRYSFKKQFASYLEAGVGSEDIEGIYTEAYAAIREDPTFKPTDKSKDWSAETKKHRDVRLTHAQRKVAIEAKISKFHAGADAAEDGASEFHTLTCSDL